MWKSAKLAASEDEDPVNEFEKLKVYPYTFIGLTDEHSYNGRNETSLYPQGKNSL